MIEGKAAYTIGYREYTVKKGDLICIPKGTYRSAVNIPEDLMECYSTNFFLRDQNGQDINLPNPVISHISTIPKLICHFHDIHDEWLQRDFGDMMKGRGILCLILHQSLNVLLNDSSLERNDSRIKKSIRYMSDHYGGLIPSPSRLLWKPVSQSHGMIFRPYVTSLRLNYAENMLRSGEYSVSDTALQCGFSDIFYFSKVFKKKRAFLRRDYFRWRNEKSQEEKHEESIDHRRA